MKAPLLRKSKRMERVHDLKLSHTNNIQVEGFGDI